MRTACSILLHTMDKLVVYTDGGSRNNPGPGAAGVVILRGEETVAEAKQFLGEKITNNWAEYEAVVLAMGRLLELNLRGADIEFKLDSMLVVEQLKGNWKIKEPTLKPQVEKVRSLAGNFGSITFTYVPREQNKRADALVNEALDEAGF